jgi:hypothetical protein
MTTKQLIYQFRLLANKIDSNATTKLSLPACVDFINSGMLQLCKSRYTGNNNYRQSLESVQKRIDEWQRLIVPHHLIDGEDFESDNRITKFELPFDNDYMFLLRCSFLASKGDCKDQPVYDTFANQTDDLNNNFDNPNSISNFEWRFINYRIAQDNILAYSDSTFSIDKADIDFLRYPKKVDIKGYTRIDNTPSDDIECELPEFLHDEIVNEAVLNFKLSLGHPDVNLAGNRKAIEE